MTKKSVIPLNLTLWHSGKVRDTASLPNPLVMLPVASDRLSTHNKVHESEVPGKGEILTAQMLFFALTVLRQHNIPTHLVAWGRRIFDHLPRAEYEPRLHYRALVVKRWKLDPVEFVYRNHFPYSSSLYRDWYSKGLDPYEIDLPPGLPNMYKFPEKIFTPTDKSDSDDPLPSLRTANKYRKGTFWTGFASQVVDDYLEPRGITKIDDKSEGSALGLADEFFTGDCCRFARTKEIRLGEEPGWLDKECFRQEALRLWGDGPRIPLTFSDSVIKEGIGRYHEAFEAITDMTLSRFQKEYMN